MPELAPDPAYELLATLAPEACAADPQLSRRLAQAVGGLPLDIELLGGYLAAPENSTFADLSQAALAELSDPQRRLQLASARLGGLQGSAITLQDTIGLSLSDLPEPARQAFHALGAFAAKPEILTRDAAVAVTQADARTLALLIARNLLEQSGESLSLHQVIADFARARPDLDAMVRHRDYYLAQANKDRQDWRHIESVYGQVKYACSRLPEESIVLNFVRALRVHQRLRDLWYDAME